MTSVVLASGEPLLSALVRGVTALDSSLGVFAASSLDTSALGQAVAPLAAVFVANPSPSWSLRRIDRTVRAIAPDATVATAFVRDRASGDLDRVDEIAMRWLRSTPVSGIGDDSSWTLRQESCRLAPELTAPATARRFVHTVLGRWERADLEEPALLCASELVTNAVLHAPFGAIDVVLADAGPGDREMLLSVVDRGADRMPVGRRPSTQSRGGRGLRIVEASSCRWGVTVGATSKHVWCELASPPVVTASDATEVRIAAGDAPAG